MAKRCKRIIGPKQVLAAMRERVFVVRKGEDGDAVLVELPAPGQKRPANGREHVGRHEDTTQEVGAADEASNAPAPAPLLDLMETR